MTDLVQQALNQIKLDSERDRQDSQEKRLSMYLDDYQDETYSLLKKQFHKDNVKRLYPMLATYYNLFKKIINLKSVIYSKEANRQWYKRDGETTDDNYSGLMANTNISTVAQLCNKLTNVNNTSFIRVLSDQGKIRYENVPSELISITQNPDNPSEIQSLLHRVTIQDTYDRLNNIGASKAYYANRDSQYTYKYFYWDKDNYIILDKDLEKKEEYDNPYRDKDGNGIIPYVLFSSFPSISGSVWNETLGSDLYDGTLQVSVFQTYLSNILKQAGYRQPWISGINEKEAMSLTEKASDGLQPITLTSDTAKIGTFEISSDISQVRDTIHDIISEIADNHGVSFSSRTSSAQKQSGLALSIENEAMDDIRKEQIPMYRQSEKELAKKTVIIANTDLRSNIDIEGSFSIDFDENEDYLSADEKLKVNQWYLGKNIKSVVDIYMETDPDCPDEEEALKRIDANKKINEELTDSLSFMPTGDIDEETV